MLSFEYSFNLSERMAIIINLIGSLFLLLGGGAIFFTGDLKAIFPIEAQSYYQYVFDYRWIILILGFVLSIIGTNIQIKSRRKTLKTAYAKKKNNLNKDVRLTRYAFEEGKVKHQTQQFADKQQGKLKDLAQLVDWTPLLGGGANFKTATLKKVDHSRLEVISSTGAKLFSGVFIFIGLGLTVVACFSFYTERQFRVEAFVPVVLGLLFAMAGFAMLYWPRPKVFDRRQGWFWSGDRNITREQTFMKLKQSARLSEISAIQILSESLRSKNGSYTSWEINLISEEGARLNVMDHGNYQSLLADAQLLCEFLNVPLWENT